jgi:hypothetical protein
MTNRQLELLARIMAQQALVLGMTADNQYREACGESPAWNYSDFSREADELLRISQEAIDPNQ